MSTLSPISRSLSLSNFSQSFSLQAPQTRGWSSTGARTRLAGGGAPHGSGVSDLGYSRSCSAVRRYQCTNIADPLELHPSRSCLQTSSHGMIRPPLIIISAVIGIRGIGMNY